MKKYLFLLALLFPTSVSSEEMAMTGGNHNV